MPSPTQSQVSTTFTIRPLTSADTPKVRDEHVGKVIRSGSDSTVAGMVNLKDMGSSVKKMEDIYAERFVRGDKKPGITTLNANPKRKKTYHVNTFRSGILFGLALPALASGLYQSYQPDTREDIDGWDALLYLYGILSVPVFFSVLVGLNLLTWTRSGIDYVSMFDLNIKTILDHRQYFETPGILLAALCYALWLSFSRIGLNPTTWPLVWLGFAAFVIFNPFALLLKSSRYWLVRKTGKLFISGKDRVEFTDFWLGDQFCSLIFTFANTYHFICVYKREFSDTWAKCGPRSNIWPVPVMLASVPLFIRLVQCLRCYSDSKTTNHLINAGKYGSGIVSYLFYYNWRHQGGGNDASLGLWCLFNTIYSIYGAAWDLIIDWSLLQPNNQHPLLRSKLVYANHIPVYYFAIITNVLIRFAWVIYIPHNGSEDNQRMFAVAVLEMLRRWQWNFYRVEKECIGNEDRYLVSKNVRLPYFSNDEDGDDDGCDLDVAVSEKSHPWLAWLRPYGVGS